MKNDKDWEQYSFSSSIYDLSFVIYHLAKRFPPFRLGLVLHIYTLEEVS